MKHLTRNPWARPRRDTPALTVATLTVATLILLPVAVFAGEASAAGAEPPRLTAKGIYYDVDRYQRSGLKFRVILDENGKDRQVATGHPFRTGDRFSFSFEINRDTYVYVINRTQTSAAMPVAAGYQAKRIKRPQLSEPRLLFPTSRAGNNNRLASNKAHAVPSHGSFVMDAESGLEKLYVVISDKRLDFSDFFNAGSGELRGSANPRASTLQAKLDGWKGNAVVELVSKGIVHQVDSYGATVDASKPAVVEIDLKHYR